MQNFNRLRLADLQKGRSDRQLQMGQLSLRKGPVRVQDFRRITYDSTGIYTLHLKLMKGKLKDINM